YASAGIPFPLLLRDGCVTSIKLTGTPLGLFDTCQFDQTVVRLQPGDRLLFYSDGLPDSLQFLYPHLGEGNEQVEHLLTAHPDLSAAALADDLRRFLANEPIAARPVGKVERTYRWCRRNPVTATLFGMLITSLTIGTAVSCYFAVQATTRAEQAHQSEAVALQEKDRADSEAERARHESLISRRRLYAAHMNLAQRASQEGRIGRLLELLDEQRPRHTGGVDLRGFEWYYLWKLCKPSRRQSAKAT
ncbi:MAG: SpoIIE family protein phosphatase, partial [Planctomycetes bacterium]|nr:SpoIIE family protein phosphatase [Planctomycetota bacterium]